MFKKLSPTFSSYFYSIVSLKNLKILIFTDAFNLTKISGSIGYVRKSHLIFIWLADGPITTG